MLLHIATLRLDIDGQQNTHWHRLAPQTRLFCALLLVFATALTPNGHWWTWGIYGLAVMGVIQLTQVTLSVLLQRVAIELTFVGTVLLGTLFRGRGRRGLAVGMVASDHHRTRGLRQRHPQGTVILADIKYSDVDHLSSGAVASPGGVENAVALAGDFSGDVSLHQCFDG